MSKKIINVLPRNDVNVQEQLAYALMIISDCNIQTQECVNCKLLEGEDDFCSIIHDDICQTCKGSVCQDCMSKCFRKTPEEASDCFICCWCHRRKLKRKIDRLDVSIKKKKEKRTLLNTEYHNFI